MKIAFIGTGLLGQPMARRLLEADYEVIAYNRTREKAEALIPDGAKVAATALEAIQQGEVVILMLLDANAIRQTLFKGDSSPDFKNKTVIQMGTILPRESQELAEEIVALGGEYLEAPVLGSRPEASAGRLIVMVGSTEAQYQTYKSLLSVFGPDPVHIGAVGDAAAVKLALNQLIVSLISAFSLSLGMVRRRGLDVEKFMSILRRSALYAPAFDKKLPRMLERNFSNPNFPTQHLLKDVRLILQEAQQLGLNTAMLEAVKNILEEGLEKGLMNLDYSAIYEAIDPSPAQGDDSA